MAYLLLILVLVFLFFRFFAASPQVEQARLSDVVSAIDAKRVRDTVLKDQDQKITAPTPTAASSRPPTPSSRARTRSTCSSRRTSPPASTPAASRCWSRSSSSSSLRRAPAAVLLPHAADAGRRQLGDELRQVQGLVITKDQPKITFQDVAGVDEVEELQEIKEFLENPAKFQAMGAKIPKGVLLFGPPGTGKPCSPGPWPARPGCCSSPSPARTSWRCSSVSAPSRVRDLFEQAKANAPAIVFVDEIDAVGRQRGAGAGPGRRPRRARADPEPAAGRDGRLRREVGRDPDRGHQPARHPRPGSAAPGPLRPPDHRRPARLPRAG